MFKEIHGLIVDDNTRSGTKPLSSNRSLVAPSSSSDPVPRLKQTSPRPVSMLEAVDIQQFSGSSDPHDDYEVSRAPEAFLFSANMPRQKPSVHPKPIGLHAPSRASNNGSNHTSSDVLAERFAQLRMQKNEHSGIIQIPSPEHYSSIGSSFPTLDQVQSEYREKRPTGPRAMPSSSSNLPPLPPKLPIEPKSANSLPRAPSPAYNPARNLQSPSSIIPPRSTVRSLAVNGSGSSYPMTNTASYSLGDESETRSSMQDNSRSAVSSTKIKSADLPNPTVILAEELYDRVREFNVLLIDVRNRDEYDQGHIFAKCIMCIEPLSLRHDVSADDLEERLVVSPEAEQLLFERRHEFDLVVYYDQSTSSSQFLRGPPDYSTAPALRALHDTLYNFNYEKGLRRPPAFLLGGLDAWVDIVGPQALQTSRTSALIGTARPRRSARVSGRRLSRTPLATFNSSIEVRRRRLQEHNPLDAEEERAWREKARNEEVEPSDYYQQVQSDGDTDSVSSHQDEPISPLIHSYEDFLRKFPEPGAIQQSMTGARPRPLSRPAPIIPQIPSRPPPTLSRPSYSGVSERDFSGLSPTSRQPSGTQPPLYTSRSITHYLKLPRTGLINFSVTCYMNATIQCLLATIPLSQFFLDNRWRDFTQKNWKGSNGVMPEIYANLIRSLWRNDVQAVRPSSLRNFCARLNREWGVDRQQDAKEFFDFLIDCLHEDLNFNWERSALQPLTAEQEMTRERMPINQVSKVEWDRYCHRENSFISNLFAGQHASLLRCRTCGNTSTTYEAFYSISVEIPRSGRGDIRECLRSYCQEEMLSGDEEWKCPHCKCEREATKRITLTRLPQVLVIHFKRFSASKTESARKVHTPIDFPLHGLNMGPYMASTQIEPKSSDAKVDPAITPPFQYDAYAVMRHLGQTGNGGHYISLVRDAARACWRKFDDEKATDFEPAKLKPEQRLQNEQAYIVFYGRSAAR